MATSVRRTAKWRALSPAAQHTYDAIARACKASRHSETRASRFWGDALDELLRAGLVREDDRGPGWPMMLFLAD